MGLWAYSRNEWICSSIPEYLHFSFIGFVKSCDFFFLPVKVSAKNIWNFPYVGHKVSSIVIKRHQDMSWVMTENFIVKSYCVIFSHKSNSRSTNGRHQNPQSSIIHINHYNLPSPYASSATQQHHHLGHFVHEDFYFGNVIHQFIILTRLEIGAITWLKNMAFHT